MERSGAAQGLAEAFAALGPAHLDALLPSILAQCTVKQAAIREGHMTLLKFLPVALPDSFQVPARDTKACKGGRVQAQGCLPGVWNVTTAGRNLGGPHDTAQAPACGLA